MLAPSRSGPTRAGSTAATAATQAGAHRFGRAEDADGVAGVRHCHGDPFFATRLAKSESGSTETAKDEKEKANREATRGREGEGKREGEREADGESPIVWEEGPTRTKMACKRRIDRAPRSKRRIERGIARAKESKKTTERRKSQVAGETGTKLTHAGVVATDE